jgi:toxin CptA
VGVFTAPQSLRPASCIPSKNTMSIAVSAVTHPSRLLRASLAACAAAHLGASLALAAGALGQPAGRGLLALACAWCALLLARQALQGQKVRRIDISGLGEIRLTVQQEASGVGPLALCPGSTLWPQLLLLRLRRQGGGGKARVLLLLPDSVAPGAFRALAVALRHVAERDNKFFRNNKIL